MRISREELSENSYSVGIVNEPKLAYGLFQKNLKASELWYNIFPKQIAFRKNCDETSFSMKWGICWENKVFYKKRCV